MTSVASATLPQARPGLRDVMASGEFRALLAGQAQSAIGDQVARVALAVLVYDRTRSPLLTAVAYAGSYLPWLAGGLVLAALADRLPRRAVLVGCDLGRGALIALMAVPGMPLPAMIALLYAASLLDGPFYAARSATFRDALPGDRYRPGVTIAATALQLAAMAGLAVGGILVAAIGARLALAADAATFAVSALLIRVAVPLRPAAAPAAGPLPAQVASGLRLVFGDRRLRVAMLAGWLAAFYAVPAALAVPLAAAAGGGPAAAGLIFAAAPLGTAAGTLAYGRLLPPAAQARLMGPASAACCGVLALFLARPGLAGSVAILAASGALAGYQVAASTSFVQALRRDQQAQAFGLATAGIWTVQGLAFLAAGAAAGAVAPAVVVACFGIAGAAAALALLAAARAA